MMPAVLSVVPVITTLLLTIVACLPWGGPPWSEIALALLPATSVYYWSLRRPALLPAVLVFGCGVLLDVLTHGPLGVWAVGLLTVALAARKVRRLRPPLGWLRGTMMAALTFALALSIVAGLESAYAWQPVVILPHLHALAAICLAYPVLAGLLALFDALWPAADGRSLFARGD